MDGPPRPDDVGVVLAHALAAPPRLGRSRLITVDGRAGSGKTTLAAALRARTGATVVHLDELLDGWHGGLDKMLDALVDDVLDPLARGGRAAYHRYDWTAGAFAEWVPVAPTDVLVVEGVGSGGTALDRFRTTLVWTEAPPAVRRERALARDGEAFSPWWDHWSRLEEEHYARERTRQRADVVVAAG